MTRARTLGLLVALLASAADAQQVDRAEADASVRTVITVDGTIQRDSSSAVDGSGLTINANVETDAEGARRDAVDLLNGGATGTRPLVVTRDTETVVEADRVVSESTGRTAKACVQIGAIGTQKSCRPR